MPVWEKFSWTRKKACLPSDKRVVGPLEQGLPLAWAAGRILRFAIHLYLRRMAAKGAPALDLLLIYFGQPSAQIITAIPLEPAARIGPKNPALVAPYRKRLAAFDPEAIERRIGHVAEFCIGEPILGQFIAAVIAIFAFEYAKRQHFFRCEKRIEPIGESLTRGCDNRVAVTALHAVIHGDDGALRVVMVWQNDTLKGKRVFTSEIIVCVDSFQAAPACQACISLQALPEIFYNHHLNRSVLSSARLFQQANHPLGLGGE